MRKGKRRFLAALMTAFMLFQAGAFGLMSADSVWAEGTDDGKLQTEQAKQVRGEYNFGESITSASIKVKIGDEWYDVTKLPEGKTVPKDAPIDVKIAYNPEGIQFSPGSTMHYQIPEGIKLLEEQTGRVMDGRSEAGKYVISTAGEITITLNDDYLSKHNGYIKNGTIGFSGSFDGDKWGQGGDKEIQLGDQTITIPFTPDPVVEQGAVNITKSIEKDGNKEIKYDPKKGYYIEYKVTVSTPADNTKVMHDITVKDVFTAGGEYVDMIGKPAHPNFYDIDTGGVGEFKYEKDAAAWVWSGIGNMEPGTSYDLTFKVKLNDKLHEAGADGDRVVTNKVEVKSDEDGPREATASAKENSSLNITKVTDGYDVDKKTVTYTLKVKAADNNTWTINNVTVKDIFGNNSEYVEEYVSIKPSKGSITNDDRNQTKKLDWNIGSMQQGEEQTLVYTVKIKDSMFLKGNTGTTDEWLNNTAHLFVGDKETDNANAGVNFKKVWIGKSGVYNEKTGKIDFTVTANHTMRDKDGNIIVPPIDANFTITDNLDAAKDWVYDGNINIQRYEYGPEPMGKAVGDPVIVDANEKTSWSWKETKNGSYYYVITYSAKLKDNGEFNPIIGGTPNINGADIEIDTGKDIGLGGDGTEGTIDYDHNANWSGNGKYFDSLSKEFVSRKGDVAAWQSKITCNVPSGAVYNDWRDSAQGHEWSFTSEQLAAIKVTAGDVELEKDKDYSVEAITAPGPGFKITFLKNITASEADPILIDYSNTLRTDNIDEGLTKQYFNQANLIINGHTDNAQADCRYTQPLLMQKSAGKNAYDPKTGQVTWDIKVNVTGHMEGEATIIDNLPEGLEYVKAEISDRGSKAKDTKLTTDASKDKTKVTMKLDGLVKSLDANAFVNIKLTTKVTDEDFLSGNGDKHFTNTATLKFGDITKDSSADIDISNKALSKSGKYNSSTAPDIEYTINVNPNGLDMLANAETIRVEDTMGTNMMLNTSSLLVKNSKTNEAIDVTGTLKLDGNKFSFEVPDDQPIVITYKAYVMGEVGDDATVTNTVAYYGKEPTSATEAENSIKITESNATIESDPLFYIIKKDKNDINKVLEGAEFTLYQVNDDGTLGDKVAAEITGKDGYAMFSGLDEDTVYAFHETKAPKDYYIDEANAAMTYVAFAKDAVKPGMSALKIDIIQSGIAYERYNEEFFGSLEMTKTNGKDGAAKKVLEGAEFELYMNVEGEDAQLMDKFTTDENGLLKAENLREGSYYLVETKAPKGYKINMDKNGEAMKYPFEIGPNGGEQVINYTCEIANTEIPGGGIKTGDDSNIGIFALMAMLSATLAGIVLVRRRLD